MSEVVLLAAAKPADVALSPDGSKVYSAGVDGYLRAYDLKTGALVNSWSVGTSLGGMDISPDGSFLIVVERQTASTSWAVAYKVDLVTGERTSFPVVTSGSERAFFDVAILSDDNVLLSQSLLPGLSGWTSLKLLNTQTGQYSVLPDSVRQNTILSDAADGSRVLAAESDISDAPLKVYETGSGIVAHHGLYADNVSGFNYGVQAYNAGAGLVAQHVPGNGLHIYSGSLQYQRDLDLLYPQWSGSTVSGLQFDAAGAHLFVLDIQIDSIVQLRTSDWTVVQTIPVGVDLTLNQGGYGNRLLVDPQGRYFSIIGENGLVLVKYPASPGMVGTEGSDLLEGALFGEAIRGGAGKDSLYGHGGDDTLDGGAGVDILDGGVGDDLYLVDDAFDRIIERAGEGYDTVLTSVDYSLRNNPHVEVLAASDMEATVWLQLWGDAYDNTIIGNAGANALWSGGGSDILIGLGGDDLYFVDDLAAVVVEKVNGGRDQILSTGTYTLVASSHVELLRARDQAGSESLTLIGNEFAQTITGNAGANLIVGGGGADVLVGFGGDDDYLVDNASVLVHEQVGGGYDSVYAVGSYTLTAGSHIELLTAHDQASTQALTLIGNELGQTILGNAGNNLIVGGGGGDILVGFGGNDDYLVSDARDYAAEHDGGGFDSIYTTTSHTIGYSSHVELLTAHDQAGIEALTLIGNRLGQAIYGNAGSNLIVGGGGSDVLTGLGGDDDYLVESQAEEVVEHAGGGTDSIYTLGSYALSAGAHVEQLIAHDQAGTQGITLTGNEVGQTIIGNAGANYMDGGAGADVLIGGGGADAFGFTTALGGGNVDTLADFQVGADVIVLDAAIFALTPGQLAASAFHAGPAAADAADRIIYDAGTGALFYDADGAGAGAAVQFASVAAGLGLTAASFEVVGSPAAAAKGAGAMAESIDLAGLGLDEALSFAEADAQVFVPSRGDLYGYVAPHQLLQPLDNPIF